MSVIQTFTLTRDITWMKWTIVYFNSYEPLRKYVISM